MSKKRYKIIYLHDEIEENFDNKQPFNIKADLKKIKNKKELVDNLADEIVKPDSPPQRCRIHEKIIKGCSIKISKIRLPDEKGKSGGIRAIVLVDEYHKIDDLDGFVFLIHVFLKKEKDDLSQAEKNILRNFFNEVVQDIERRGN